MSDRVAFQIMTNIGLHKMGVSGDQDAADALLGIFDTVGTDSRTINVVQCASASLKSKLDAFVDTYAADAPHLHAFRKSIADLKTDSYFLLIPYEFASSLERLKHEELLASLNDTPLYPAGAGAVKHAIEALLSSYEFMSPRNDKRVIIGERHPDRKTCRFCSRAKRDGATFRKVAHAISEGLGNKNIVASEECDECNEFFGASIEPALIELLNVHRTYLGLKGKAGHPQIVYKDGSLTHDGSKVIIEARKFEDDGSGTFVVSLGTGKAIAIADCYKALCKFAISIIAHEELEHLAGTIAWLRAKDGSVPLPKLATCIVRAPSQAPQIALYTRRNDDNRHLPHVVCEFRLGPFVYVYKMPFSSREVDAPLDFFNDPAFKALFAHYEGFDWKTQDFSRTTPTPLDMTLHILPPETEYLAAR